MSRNSFAKNRRQFFQQSAAALGGLALACGSGRNARAAQTGLLKRRHLINVMTYGGWDSTWFHNGALTAELAGVLEDKGSILGSDGKTFLFSNHLGSGGDQYADQALKWNQRYLDSHTLTHPSGHILGPGMSLFDADTLGSMCIWRGIQGQGGHIVGNGIIMNGTDTSGVSSFTTLVADFLAKNNQILPLHHVTTGGTYASRGPIVGPAEAVLIPSVASFKNLISPGVNDLDATRRALVKQSLSDLTAALSPRLVQKQSQAVYSALLTSINGFMSLKYQNYGVAFNPILDYYSAEIPARMAKLVVAGTSQFPSSIFAEHPAFAGVNLSSLAAVTTALTSWATVPQLAFEFAMAEFLVANNLSAVVDLVGDVGNDAHSNNLNQILCQLAMFSGVSVLLQRLRTTPIAKGDGDGQGNLLDITTFMMGTEMDRSPLFTSNGGNQNMPGTDHWGTVSYVLAGAGIKGGTVVGDFATGPQGKYAVFGAGVFAGLPTDPKSGQPSQSGQLLTVRSIFPTILSLFGATQEAQITITAPICQGVLS